MTDWRGKLQQAQKNKADEFYTCRIEIEKELPLYAESLKDKTVYINCDDQSFSEFWFYLTEKFHEYKLKKLYCSWLGGSLIEYDGTVGTESFLFGDEECQAGDFRSRECLAVVDKSDIVIGNPPFSIIRDFIKATLERGRDVLIIAPALLCTYKDTYHYFQDGILTFGYHQPRHYFCKYENKELSVGAAMWVTSLKAKKMKMTTKEVYDETKEYPKYDNYDAYDCSDLKRFPKGFKGRIGVPVTIFKYLQPEGGNSFTLDGQKIKVLGLGKEFCADELKIKKYNNRRILSLRNKFLFGRVILECE